MLGLPSASFALALTLERVGRSGAGADRRESPDSAVAGGGRAAAGVRVEVASVPRSSGSWARASGGASSGPFPAAPTPPTPFQHTLPLLCEISAVCFDFRL